MKKIIILGVICCLIAISAIAGRSGAKPTEEPAISLRLALTLAEEDLKAEQTKYYCLSAGYIGTWELHFGSKDGKEMWVAVGRDKEVRKSAEPFEH